MEPKTAEERLPRPMNRRGKSRSRPWIGISFLANRRQRCPLGQGRHNVLRNNMDHSIREISIMDDSRGNSQSVPHRIASPGI
jgi:hypothetical protein